MNKLGKTRSNPVISHFRYYQPREIVKDREAWPAAVHGVQSQIRLSDSIITTDTTKAYEKNQLHNCITSEVFLFIFFQ